MTNFRVELPKNNPLSGYGRDIRAGHDLNMRSPIGLNAQYVSRWIPGSPDGPETGCFWQRNFVFPQSTKASDNDISK